ncbi:MAG: SUMF1/EgtB/PvdO family nonheme iron enzyme [Chloroflexi bacterium]|uniref:bifunctional serine/threonine-protein kinase/formylglycine-generating enzyme family protein n=1 Tax=Candidatus Flexifilum breve TaxID=3140694 RepID=UPI0031352076|nr:SUMF1/EgtB/PvdO family nonheme iron enzyme [Chloroflexota bacterium]
MNDLIGREIGQYKITSLLGWGTSAAVYLAQQLNAFERPVAIKVIRAELIGQGDFARRLEQEARTIATLRHTHILRLIEYINQGNLVCLVMDYLPGGNLESLISEGTLTIERTDRLAAQIADALDYAHNQNIIHRDLKPQNVLLDEAGNAVLSDFGIAKLLSGSTNLTQTGAIVGTPSYMSPEQWKGLPLDRRSDIYAFGILVYEMLTGVLPFQAESASSMMYKHLTERPSPVEAFRTGLPAAVNAVLLRALAKEPDDRYATAGELYRELHLALFAPEGAALHDMTRSTLHKPPPVDDALVTSEMMRVVPVNPRRRIPLVPLVAGLIAVVALGVVLVVTQFGAPPEPTPTVVPTAARVAGQNRTDERGVQQVFVPEGCFQMGSDIRVDSRAFDNEEPAHEVCLTGFWLDIYEVTNGQFQAFVDDGGYTTESWWSPEGWAWVQQNGFVGPENRGGELVPEAPRSNLSWYEADAYARWRGGRLPTEAEWEYAARGADNLIYVWGNGWSNGYSVVNETSTGGVNFVAPLGGGSRTLDRSWSGVFDLVGNVSEWVNDWFGDYPAEAVQDPLGPSEGTQRVVRGGNFNSSPEAARLAIRVSRDPGRRSPSVGVRVATP